MNRLAFVFRTDVHAADKGPESWKGDYAEEIFSDLVQIGDIAKAHQASAVLDGGDFFHVKRPSANSHGLVARIARIHSAYPCPVWSIEGNHDIAYNNLDTLERQPLGVLYDAGVFKHLREEVFQSGPLQVRVVGVPYVPDRSLDFLRGLKKKPGDTHLIAIVHALAGKNPPAHVEDFFGEPVFRYGDLVFDQGPDAWCFGHWHRDQGIERLGDRWFVNQGSVSRGALVHENLERIPKVAVLTITDAGLDVQSVRLQVAPASEVFDLERKDRRDQEGEIIERFVRRLEEDAKFDASESVEESVKSLGFAHEIRDLALTYLERGRAQRLREK